MREKLLLNKENNTEKSSEQGFLASDGLLFLRAQRVKIGDMVSG